MQTVCSQQHAALIGTSATPACPLCQKVFTTTEALIEHMTIHKEGSSSSNSNPGMGGDGRNSSLMTIFPPIIQEDGPKAILQQSQEPKESGVSASLQQQDQGNSQQTQPNPSGTFIFCFCFVSFYSYFGSLHQEQDGCYP